MIGIIGAAWGIVGLSLILGSALYRLYPHAQALCDTPLAWHHWIALVASLLFMGYAEGYKGFHLKFSPRAAARALYLKNNPTDLLCSARWHGDEGVNMRPRFLHPGNIDSHRHLQRTAILPVLSLKVFHQLDTGQVGWLLHA